jgi:hypothetical protein
MAKCALQMSRQDKKAFNQAYKNYGNDDEWDRLDDLSNYSGYDEQWNEGTDGR